MIDNTDDILKNTKRQKRRKRIKALLLFFIILLLVIPPVLSIFLMLKVNHLENKLNQYILKEDSKNEIVEINTAVAKAKEKSTTTPIRPTQKPEVVQEKRVYLTFEDGPSQCTQKILDVLKSEKVKATFFVIGHEDDFSKMIYKRIVKEGHTLGMHSYSHIYKEVYATPDAFQTDFMKLQNYLFKVTGVKSKYYRFPGGSSTPFLNKPISEYAKRLKDKQITYLDWNVINGDATGKSLKKTKMIQNVINGVKEFDVSIVQMHDASDKKVIANSLRPLIRKLKSSGYKMLPIDENTTSIKHAQ